MSTETYTNVPLMAVPDELRWAVAERIDLHTAGWEVSGYQERRRLRGYLETFFRRYDDA